MSRTSIIRLVPLGRLCATWAKFELQGKDNVDGRETSCPSKNPPRAALSQRVRLRLASTATRPEATLNEIFMTVIREVDARRTP
jgi:hypothetical protein